jgi:hypothetical protein
MGRVEAVVVVRRVKSQRKRWRGGRARGAGGRVRDHGGEAEVGGGCHGCLDARWARLRMRPQAQNVAPICRQAPQWVIA